MTVKPAAPAATVAKTVKFDFSTLIPDVVEAADLPKATRKSHVQDSPVYGWMQESLAAGKGRGVTIPADQVKALTTAVRASANALECGSKVTATALPDGQVRVVFVARPRRAYKARGPRTPKVAV